MRFRPNFRLALALSALMAGSCVSAGPGRSIPLSDVQGAGHESPYAGSEVTVTGVVTAVLTRERDAGFFLQDAAGDGDVGTSDAVFVDMVGRDISGMPSRGDLVEITGTVEERRREKQLSITTITNAEVLTVRSNAELPAPVVLGLTGRPFPLDSLASEGLEKYDPLRHTVDYWESLEGMLVEVREPVITGPYSFYGDLVVIGDGGPAGIRRSSAGGVLLRESDLNLDRVVLDARLASPAPVATVGDRFVAPLRGVVHYDFASYRLLPLEWPDLSGGGIAPETTAITSGANAMTVASYNVLNLSFANPERRFEDVARTIVANLRSPDMIALQEIQDDSGPNREPDAVVSAARTLERLVDAVVAAGGPRYSWAQIDPELDRDGGQPGGNIRVAWLYLPERVTFVPRGSAGPLDAASVRMHDGRPSLTLNPGRIEPRNACFEDAGAGGEGSRKPLAIEVEFRGERVFLINNHLASKSDDDRIFGSSQPPRRVSEEQRTCQATVVAGFARAILALDPRAAVVVLGDMNEHEFREPLRPFENATLVSLLERVPAARRYTYNFEGNSQVLDHIYVSPGLAERSGIAVDIVHVNTDFPARTAASDHDPVVALLPFD